MKKYNITVNGTAYEVEVEEVGGTPVITSSAPAPAVAHVAPTSAPAAPAPAPATPVASSTPSAGAVEVESPMPGTILNVLVSQGQAVSDGDVLLILEAMKMENEIVAPQAGIVDAILVEKGATVNPGDVLISIK
ncbi:MAG: biotin/lipoyl-binding protein [Clostridiales Family XIII bacterium]|jgi:biotin carboxyl carrier protein|nr:biotin/lipoyl-binding protein [Clostridiales Family XIII bacterium]